MTKAPKHIDVCICTYRRPDLLSHLLEELGRQETGGLFTYSVVVADNDEHRSAEKVVTHFAAASSIPVSYRVEPHQNIAFARNMAIENTSGTFAAFIDGEDHS